jgi:hypothetical protein
MIRKSGLLILLAILLLNLSASAQMLLQKDPNKHYDEFLLCWDICTMNDGSFLVMRDVIYHGVPLDSGFRFRVGQIFNAIDLGALVDKGCLRRPTEKNNCSPL